MAPISDLGFSDSPQIRMTPGTKRSVIHLINLVFVFHNKVVEETNKNQKKIKY